MTSGRTDEPGEMAESCTPSLIREHLYDVEDPELGLSILELGLVYDVRVDEGDVLVEMTLTSPACPVGPRITAQVEAVVSALPGVRSTRVRLVWDPPWDPHTMTSEDVKLSLGIW